MHMHMHMRALGAYLCIYHAYAMHISCIYHAYIMQLTPELLGIAIKRELSQIPAAVRNGSGIVSALSWLTNYTDADNDLNGAPPYRHPAHLWASVRSASTHT